MSRLYVALLLVCAVSAGVCRGSQQIDDLRADVEKLRVELAKKESEPQAPISRVDAFTDCHYGPNEVARTKNGKLTIGILTQVWYQHINNSSRGLVVPAPGNALPQSEPGQLNDNDTFRIRRTEMRFNIDINENVNAYVMIDPTRESNVQFTPVPTFPLHNTILTNSHILDGSNRHAGNTIIPQKLQDAYINYHGIIPHHDFTIGQFKPPSGEEAWRNSGQLDFVDRAMVTSVNNVRDIGVMAHGSWVDGRVQYWVGAFNGPDGTVLNDPEIVEGGNRPDTNDSKDVAERVAVNPVWSTEKWYGRLQVGYARTDGEHGRDGQGFSLAQAVNGLNRQRTKIYRNAAWLWYRPNDKAKGLWVRGEFGDEHDVYDPFFRTDLLNLGSGDSTGAIAFPDGNSLDSSGQAAPKPVTIYGYYAAMGYKFSDSIFAKCLENGNAWEKILHDMEFCARFEQFQNVAAESLSNPDRNTSLFRTNAFWGGINYYIKGYDARIQMNYIAVRDPVNALRGIRDYSNNTFIMSFQVMF